MTFPELRFWGEYRSGLAVEEQVLSTPGEQEQLNVPVLENYHWAFNKCLLKKEVYFIKNVKNVLFHYFPFSKTRRVCSGGLEQSISSSCCLNKQSLQENRFYLVYEGSAWLILNPDSPRGEDLLLLKCKGENQENRSHKDGAQCCSLLWEEQIWGQRALSP